MPEHRRRFSPQFKAEAVQLVLDTSRPGLIGSRLSCRNDLPLWAIQSTKTTSMSHRKMCRSAGHTASNAGCLGIDPSIVVRIPHLLARGDDFPIWTDGTTLPTTIITLMVSPLVASGLSTNCRRSTRPPAAALSTTHCSAAAAHRSVHGRLLVNRPSSDRHTSRRQRFAHPPTCSPLDVASPAPRLCSDNTAGGRGVVAPEQAHDGLDGRYPIRGGCHETQSEPWAGVPPLRLPVTKPATSSASTAPD